MSLLSPEHAPPSEVTRDLFLEWRAPRVGRGNPHSMTNPVWQWLARHPDLSAYAANAHFEGPSSCDVGPGWTFNRFGQTRTELPDGRVVAIGGEHEDWYDSDFHIYNDVAIFRPGDGVEIFGYPTDVFPPTDFHSATLVGDRIVIIGRTGYEHRLGWTEVRALGLDRFDVSSIETSGPVPGWIQDHDARRDDDGSRIIVSGGRRSDIVGGEYHQLTSADDWALHTSTWTWTRLTDRRWSEWVLRRADRRSNSLFEVRNLHWERGLPQRLRARVRDPRSIELETRIGQEGLASYEARYAPSIEHEVLPEDPDACFCTSIRVGDVVVRFDESCREVRVVVEGQLPDATVAHLLEETSLKLARIDDACYETLRLQ
jgi:hypothetical protein